MTISGHMLRMAAATNRGEPPGSAIVMRLSAGSTSVTFPGSGVVGTWDWGDGSSPTVNPAGVQTKSLAAPATARFEGTISGGSVLAYGGVTHVVDWIEGPIRYSFGGNAALVALPDWLPMTVTSLAGLVASSPVFNQPLPWDTSAVVNMSSAFSGASAFNQPLPWDTSAVSNMNAMFDGATSFDQNLSGWCVPNVMSKPSNFDNNTPAWVKAGRQPIWGTCP